MARALPDGRSVVIAGLRVVPADSEQGPQADGPPGTAYYYSPKTRSLVVKCADDKWLGVEKLQTQDRAMLGAKEWWNGMKGMGWVDAQTGCHVSVPKRHSQKYEILRESASVEAQYECEVSTRQGNSPHHRHPVSTPLIQSRRPR